MRATASVSMSWFTVAIMPRPMSFLMISEALTPSFWERSATLMASTIFTTLLAALTVVISVFFLGLAWDEAPLLESFWYLSFFCGFFEKNLLTSGSFWKTFSVLTTGFSTDSAGAGAVSMSGWTRGAVFSSSSSTFSSRRISAADFSLTFFAAAASARTGAGVVSTGVGAGACSATASTGFSATNSGSGALGAALLLMTEGFILFSSTDPAFCWFSFSFFFCFIF